MLDTLTHAQRETLAHLLTPALQRKVRGFLTRRCFGTLEADDVYGDALYRIVRYFDTFKTGTDFEAWAMQVTKSALWSAIDKRQRTLEQEALPDSMLEGWDARIGDSTHDPSARVATKHHLRSVLPLLSYPQRTAVLMRAHGFKQREIAEHLGIPIGSVGSMLERTHRELRSMLTTTQ